LANRSTKRSFSFRSHLYIPYEETLEDHGISTYTRSFSKEMWTAILFTILAFEACALGILLKTKSDFGFLSACFYPLETFVNQGIQIANLKKKLSINLCFIFRRKRKSGIKTY
jgi:hypothetical protein